MITDDAFVKLATAFSRYFKTGPDDSTLVLVPIFHNTGFADQLAHLLVSGGCTSLMGRYRTNDAAAELISHPASFLAAVPSVLRMLMLHPQADAIFAGTASIMFGGSAMPQAWVHELLSRWPHLELVNAYGLSEFTSVGTFLSSDLAATKSESVGTALSEVEIRIVDEQGNSLGPDTWGEVWLSGPTRMIGYWEEPELSSAKMPGRWLRTGDIGKIDGDGLLWLRGRLDEAINRGGEKIMPVLVESQIANHELVAAACVFGYPDPILNERVGAAIQARPGAVVDPEQLAASLRDHLPNYAIPDQWVMYDALLLNASGKFDRIAIRNEFLATHGL